MITDYTKVEIASKTTWNIIHSMRVRRRKQMAYSKDEHVVQKTYEYVLREL